MKLSEGFVYGLRRIDVVHGVVQHSTVRAVSQAHGVWFECPHCHGKNPHAVVCWFVGKVSNATEPQGRWGPQGTSIENLTLSGPIQLPCGWLGTVRNGEALST